MVVHKRFILNIYIQVALTAKDELLHNLICVLEALPNEQQPAAEPTPSNEWVERAPLPRKRHPEKSWTPHPPVPQRAKPADTKPVPQAGPSTQPPAPPPAPKQRCPAEAKPVPQAVSGPAVPVQQTMSHSVTPQAAVRTQHDDIRQRLFSDSLQRQLFARHGATLQGTASILCQRTPLLEIRKIVIWATKSSQILMLLSWT